MTHWAPLTIGGVKHCLTHVHPMMLVVTPKPGGPSLRVLVTFGCHCFARERQAGDPEDHIIPDGPDPLKARCFCPNRYGHSKNLRRIIRAAASAPTRAYFTEEQNMALIERINGGAVPYCVFFKVKPSAEKNLDVAMFVASAYEKPRLVPALPAVAFGMLIDKASKGHIPQRPERLRKW